MKALIHLVHPYVYKLQGNEFIIGPIQEYFQRDRNVTHFLSSALDKGHQVLHHRNHHPHSFNGALQDVSFRMDKLYSAVLFNPRIDLVTTSSLGTPFPDERPKEIPLERWNAYLANFSTDSQFKEKLRPRETTFFIGGCLDACLANAISYYTLHHRGTSEPLFYVPELCVVWNQSKLKEVERKLQDLNALPLPYEDALQRLKK